MRENGCKLVRGWRSGGPGEEALMRMTPRQPRQTTGIRDWSIWSLPRWLTGYVLTIIAVDLAAVGLAASVSDFSRRNLALFGLLMACTAAAVELSRRTTEDGSGASKDTQ